MAVTPSGPHRIRAALPAPAVLENHCPTQQVHQIKFSSWMKSEERVSAFAVGILSLPGAAQAGTSPTQHLPTTLEIAGETEIRFKSCFSAKKGTLITTFKFPDLQHTAPQLQQDLWS